MKTAAAPRQTTAPAETTAVTGAASWWLEDPFGSVVTGILAPTVAVAFLATVTFALASAY